MTSPEDFTATVTGLSRRDGWYAGHVDFSNGSAGEFFVTPTGKQVRFYAAKGARRGGGYNGSGQVELRRRALLVALGFPADAAGDAAPMEIISVPAPSRALREFKPAPVRASMAEIAQIVAARCGLTVMELHSPSRRPHIVVPRQRAMWAMRKAGKTTTQIGNFFSCDHATVIHASRRHEARRYPLRLDAEAA